MSATPTLAPWFRLLRLPNLLTVPGDPVAGALLAEQPCRAHLALRRWLL